MTLPFYTWADVQDDLASCTAEWPDGLYSVRAYWSGLHVDHDPQAASAVVAWLAQHFGSRWREKDGNCAVCLESVSPDQERWLPVLFDEDLGGVFTGTAWRRFTPESVALRRNPPDLTKQLSAPIFAWHSARGGVGRTTSAIQFARLLAAQPGTRVLLLDMDFHAPGLYGTQRTISVSDILTLAHGTPTADADGTFDLIRNRLAHAEAHRLIAIPALRCRQTTPHVLPQHLESPSPLGGLTDWLSALAARMGVTHVVADLPAGQVDTAASLLLDPRVHRVLVSTPTASSLVGTATVLGTLLSSAPPGPAGHPITVALNQMGSAPSAAVHGRFLAMAQTWSHLPGWSPEDRQRVIASIRMVGMVYDALLRDPPLGWTELLNRLDTSFFSRMSGTSTLLTLAQWAEQEAAPTGESHG